LIAEGETVCVQVLSELAAVVRRKAKMPWDEIRFAIENIKTLCPNPLPITLDTRRDVLSIAERYGFRIYDALIVASARKRNARSCTRKLCRTVRSSGAS
jgi:predicted nucleic acid-binding protein